MNKFDIIYFIKYIIYMAQKLTPENVKNLIKNGQKLPFATENYPSRGQTTTQELYQTEQGKFYTGEGDDKAD